VATNRKNFSFSDSKTPKSLKLHSHQRCQSKNSWFSHVGKVENLSLCDWENVGHFDEL